MLAGIKHLNRLDQVIGRAEWEGAGTTEGLLLGQDGRVVCGTMSNVFLQQGDSLLTPAVEGAGIAGVVRELALKIGRAGDTDRVRVGQVSPDQVQAADAVYLSNSLIGVARVARYGSRRYDLGLGEHPFIRETRRLCHQSRPWGSSGE